MTDDTTTNGAASNMTRKIDPDEQAPEPVRSKDVADDPFRVEGTPEGLS